jgi:hypothetical protein
MIHVPEWWNIIRTTVEYKNNDTSWHNLTGIVRNNSRGTEHVWFVNDGTFIDDENDTIEKMAGYYVINEAPLNRSLLNITILTPYMEYTPTNWNVTVINSKPSDYIYFKVMFAFLAILGAFVVTAYVVLRRFR